jgi:hypothetical protein
MKGKSARDSYGGELSRDRHRLTQRVCGGARCFSRRSLHSPHSASKMQTTSRPASASTRPAASPNPAQPYVVNTQTKVFDTAHGRLLCIADIRGRLSALNDLAREANAVAIIHTGDFGFFGESHAACTHPDAFLTIKITSQRHRVSTV